MTQRPGDNSVSGNKPRNIRIKIIVLNIPYKYASKNIVKTQLGILKRKPNESP